MTTPNSATFTIVVAVVTAAELPNPKEGTSELDVEHSAEFSAQRSTFRIARQWRTVMGAAPEVDRRIAVATYGRHGSAAHERSASPQCRPARRRGRAAF